MNDGTQTALERAFELARSGQCKGMDDIRSTLAAEGYGQAQITGYSLSKQLRALMKAANPPEDSGPAAAPETSIDVKTDATG